MAKPIRIQYDQTRNFQAGDYLKLTIDSVVQPDRVNVWDAERARIGYGFGPYGVNSVYGYGRSLGYGNGLYGLGAYGQGIRRGTYLTQTSFPAGDYTVSAQPFDVRGNAGTASGDITVQHRPKPPKPTALQISGDNLTWAWSDS